MDKQMASRECVLIAIVAAAGDTGLDRAQLQKAVFLVGEEFDERLPSNFYHFRPYMYGPFAQEVYSDIERLYDGLVVEMLAGKLGRPCYRLAPNASTGLCALPKDLESGIRQIVRWVTRMSSFDELVRAIYYLYPEQRENSVFDYSEDLAMEESLERSFRDMAAGRTRPADDPIAEIQQQAIYDAQES